MSHTDNPAVIRIWLCSSLLHRPLSLSSSQVTHIASDRKVGDTDVPSIDLVFFMIDFTSQIYRGHNSPKCVLEHHLTPPRPPHTHTHTHTDTVPLATASSPTRVRYWVSFVRTNPACIPLLSSCNHDDVIKWKHFPCYWPFVLGIHRSRWIPRTKASDVELWCFLWSAPE